MEIKIKIVRLYQHPGHGTLGVLLHEGIPACCTLEPSWAGNEKDISCIPLGVYECVKYQSLKFGATWLVRGIPGRTYILFHAGNTVEHTKGCIILGQTFEKLGGNWTLLNSGKTFKRFLQTCEPADKLRLEIVELAG